MEFNAHKPIYLQICSQLYEQILQGELKADDRILSVRDYGIQLGVNPNTIMRSYETMTAAGIIYNKRGIGYFVSDGAAQKILQMRREMFMKEQLNEFFDEIDILKIPIEEIVELYNQRNK